MIGWLTPMSSGSTTTSSQISRTFAGSSKFGFIDPAAGHGKPPTGGGGGGAVATSHVPGVLPEQAPEKPPSLPVPGGRNEAFHGGATEGKGPGGGGGGGEPAPGPGPLEGAGGAAAEEGGGLLGTVAKLALAA